MIANTAAAPGSLAYFREAVGQPGDSMADLVAAMYADDRLDAKTRELIFLGIQTALRLHAAVRVHTQRAIDSGASRAEILYAMSLAFPNAGMNGPLECVPVAIEVLVANGR
jgi:alkylhydroperoxidase/carboxymuconolactone decarboxylase family protein YurZ